MGARPTFDIYAISKENSKIVYVEKQNPSKMHCKPIPVMKTGVFITVVPAMRTEQVFPCEKNFTGKTLFSSQGWQCGSKSQLSFQFRILNKD